MDTMCNLSLGIEERAAEKATEKAIENVVMNVHSNNFSLEQISIATDKSVEEIKKIINEHETAKA